MTATFYVGDAVKVMNTLPEKSVDLILTSPPFLALRSYLPQDHPDKALEGGSQATPGAYIDWLLDVVEACARVLAPHGSLCFELGDTYSGSGGAGGDYNDGSLRDGEPKFDGSAKFARHEGRNEWEAAHPISRVSGTRGAPGGNGWALPKSLTLIPESFRWAMVYGHNPHTGRTTAPWRLRNVIRWVRPNPPVGALGDKFRPATSELMVFCKAKDRFFDLDAVREPYAEGTIRNTLKPSYQGGHNNGPKQDKADRGENLRQNKWDLTHAGAPPLDWWNIPLLDGEEPTRYGPKPRDYSKEAAATAKRRDDYNAVRAEVGLSSLSPSDGLNNPIGAPPLDWWEITAGGFSGAHYAVWPPELLVKPIKAMCPEKVCRRCGEASRRIVKDTTAFDFQPALAAHIKERREAAGVTSDEINDWFGFKEVAKNWERTDRWGAAIPNAEVWPVLKERLGLSDTFDEAVMGDRRWVEPSVTDEYRENLRHGEGSMYSAQLVEPKARHGARPMTTRTAEFVTLGFSDCGHNDYRPGLVLDPFAGSGTTLSVATGHGRDAIGIDLDERNYELALDRVGPLVLTSADGTAPRP